MERLLSGRAYHNKPRDFRLIHRELAAAVREGRRIELRIVKNVEKAELKDAERTLIAQRRSEGVILLNQ